MKLSVRGSLTETQVRAKLKQIEKLLRACLRNRTGNVTVRLAVDEKGIVTVKAIQAAGATAAQRNQCTRLFGGQLQLPATGGFTQVILIVRL